MAKPKRVPKRNIQHCSKLVPQQPWFWKLNATKGTVTTLLFYYSTPKKGPKVFPCISTFCPLSLSFFIFQNQTALSHQRQTDKTWVVCLQICLTTTTSSLNSEAQHWVNTLSLSLPPPMAFLLLTHHHNTQTPPLLHHQQPHQPGSLSAPSGPSPGTQLRSLTPGNSWLA